MKLTITKIIHENQKGFLTGRYISDYSRLLYDIMHYCKENNKPGLILLVDFDKRLIPSLGNLFIKYCIF